VELDGYTAIQIALKRIAVHHDSRCLILWMIRILLKWIFHIRLLAGFAIAVFLFATQTHTFVCFPIFDIMELRMKHRSVYKLVVAAGFGTRNVRVRGDPCAWGSSLYFSSESAPLTYLFLFRTVFCNPSLHCSPLLHCPAAPLSIAPSSSYGLAACAH
jgi:hypothetical protein